MGLDTTPIKEAIEKTFGPMSDFYWLERINLCRTKGPWGKDQPKPMVNPQGVWFHQIVPYLGVACPDEENSNVKFITTMGTVADEVIEVIKAAETLCKSDGDHMYPHRLKLSEALVALQKKRMEVL